MVKFLFDIQNNETDEILENQTMEQLTELIVETVTNDMGIWFDLDEEEREIIQKVSNGNEVFYDDELIFYLNQIGYSVIDYYNVG